MDEIVQAIVDDMPEEEFIAYIRAIKKRFSREADVKAQLLAESKASFAWMSTISKEGSLAAIRRVREETKESLLTCKLTVEILKEINDALMNLEKKNV